MSNQTEVAIYHGQTKCAIGKTTNNVHFDDKVMVNQIKVVGGTGLIKGRNYGLNDAVGFRTDMILQVEWNGRPELQLVFYDRTISRI